jgi:hypothetical protein
MRLLLTANNCFVSCPVAMQVTPEPHQVMVTHDHLRIALPSGPGGQDNYVLGLALDRSVDTVSE